MLWQHCVYASLSAPVIDLQKMPILPKKNYLFRNHLFGRREAPSAPYVRYLEKKIKEKTAILIDKPKREKVKTVRTPANNAVAALCIRFAKWACDRLTKDVDFAKKMKQMKLILNLAGM